MPSAPELIRPRLHADVHVATLPSEEGPCRTVVRRPHPPQACIRVNDDLAELIGGLDGSRQVEAIADDARARFGPDGPALLVRLLAELAERGFLEGIVAFDPRLHSSMGLFARLARPRTWRWRRAPAAIERTYRAGGWLAVTRPAFVVFSAIALVGLAATALLLIHGGVTPLVVGGRLELGAACFFAGRVALVAIHELAHGLALAKMGHRVGSAGIKLLAIFPYAFVDTSPVWLEPRRRRVGVTLAGPVSDLVFGGAAAIAVLLTRGTVREVCFQLCLAGYLAALLNLNPCLERDGYHLLSDALRRPGLRRAAVFDLQSRIAGLGARDSARPLRWYGLAVVAWGIVGAGLAVLSISGSLPVLRAAMPHDVSMPLLGSLWLVLLLPTALLVGRPLAMRVGTGGAAPVPAAVPGTTSTARSRRAMRYDPVVPNEPVMLLARGVMTDSSLRRRIRAIGPPPGLEPLGDRELRSSVTGVIFAAGGESLALAHGVGALGPLIAHTTEHVLANTNLDQLRAVLGVDNGPTQQPIHLEPNFAAQPEGSPVPVLTPPLYVPPVHHHHTGGELATASSEWAGPRWNGGPMPAWPGNNAGQVAIAHWMAAAAMSAGLPGPLPVMAGLVESNLNNNACCDHDSLGYFQMRESIWNRGPYVGYYEHPELQLEWFIHQALIVRQEAIAAGDPTFGQNPSDWGTWDANIEHPAAEYRYRYGEQLAAAEGLVGAKLTGGLGAGGWASDASTAFLRNEEAQLATAMEPSFKPKAVDVPSDGEPGFQAQGTAESGAVGGPGLGTWSAAGSVSPVPGELTGYVNPVPGAVATRVDQGVDYTLSPQGFLAPAASRIIEADASNSGWAGGGYVAAEILNGPLAGHIYYVSEGVTPAVQAGDVVSPGTPIATPVASPYNGIVGNIEAGWADPNVPGRPLAQSLEGYSGDQSLQGLEAGWSWNIFATSLGAPTGVFDGAGAGLASEVQALAANLVQGLPGVGAAEPVSSAATGAVSVSAASTDAVTAPSASGAGSASHASVNQGSTGAPTTAAADSLSAPSVGVQVDQQIAAAQQQLAAASAHAQQPAVQVSEPGFKPAAATLPSDGEPTFSAR
jgi:putative peptide zinc metalloprotease protein